MTHALPQASAHISAHARPNAIAVGGFHDGVSYDARVSPESGGRTVVKLPGVAAQVGKLTDFFAFTGDANSKYRGASGLLIPSLTNTPRVEYDANGAVLGLLLEASRINLALQSEAIDNAVWIKALATITANAGLGPDGATVADKIVEDGTTGVHTATQGVTVVAGTTYTFSAWLRAAGRQWAQLTFDDGTPNGVSAVFDLSGGTISKAAFNMGTGTGAVATIQPWSAGLYRCSISGQIATTAGRILAAPSNAASPGTNYPNYAGDSASGIHVVGVQFELGPFASSYIPTTAATVTRATDVVTRALGSEFNAAAGTLFADVADFSSADVSINNCIANLDDTTANKRYTLQRTNTAGTIRLNVFDGGVNQASIDGSTHISTLRLKAAYAYALNDFAIAADAGAVATDTLGTLPAVTTLRLGQREGAGELLFGHLRRLDYYPSRLSNAQLQTFAL